jgi:transcription initiation factor TFIIB
MDVYFKNLDSIQDKTEETRCCDDQKNHLPKKDGQITCILCKSLITNISSNPEWRFYGTDDSKNGDPTRCGMPVNQLLPESSLGSTISPFYNKDMQKIKQYQNWNGMPYKERSMWNVFNDISTICDKNNLSKIICETSKSLYKDVSSLKISRGSNRTGIIAACVFYACKECEVPRSANEIAGFFSIKSSVISKGCKNFNEIMRQNKDNNSRVLKATSITIYDFIDRFCNKLNLDQQDIYSIKKICDKSNELKLISENTPPSMASGCIFLYIKSNNINITKKEISDICKISEVTINKCYKKLESYKTELLN